jgi:hypothetical protein
MRPKVVAAAIYFCAAVVVGVTLFERQAWWFDGAPALTNFLAIAAWVGVLGFLVAGLLIFRAGSWAYRLGLFATLIALPWFVQEEVFAPWNSWVMLNYTGPDEGIPSFIVLKIPSVALIVIAAACSSIRLFPAQWMFRNAPWQGRAWPAFAAGFLVMAVWFVYSAIPYVRPSFHEGITSEFTILRVEKRGLQFHETAVFEFRDEKIWICRSNRRLFQYRFEESCGLTTLAAAPEGVQERGRSFRQFAESWTVRTSLPKALRSWNADGWYVVLKGERVLSFTSEAGTTPPAEVVGLFQGLEGLSLLNGRSLGERDVCLGFCYDPLAALGLSALETRKRLKP